jgi:hypothetical protein
MGFKDVLKAVSPLAMVADKNPNVLRGLGVVGNIAANKLENREADKELARQQEEKQAQQAQQAMALKRAAVQQTLASESTPMKKGGKVSSASKRADGCAIRGKTRA